MNIIWAFILMSFAFCGEYAAATDEASEDLYTVYHRLFVDTTPDNIPFIDLLAEIFYRLPEMTQAERELKQKIEKQFEAKFGKPIRHVKPPVQNIEKMPPHEILLNLSTIFDPERYKDLTKKILQGAIDASLPTEKEKIFCVAAL